MGTGRCNVAQWPGIAGIETFKGQVVFIPSRWDYELLQAATHWGHVGPNLADKRCRNCWPGRRPVQ